MKIAKEFDEAFDNGEDISAYVDYAKAKRPNLEQKRVNLDLPTWMIERLEQEAKRLGFAIMKIFLAQHLEKVG